MDRPSFRRGRRSYGVKSGSSRVDPKPSWRGTDRSLPYDLSPRRSIGRVHSDELLPEVPTAIRLRSSASQSQSLSTGMLPDDCTVDTSSSQGARVSKASSRTKLAARAEKSHRRDGARTLRDRDRGRSTSASNQPTNYDDASGVLSKAQLTESDFTRVSDYQTRHEMPRPESRRCHSDPAVPQTIATKKGIGGPSDNDTHEDGHRAGGGENDDADADADAANIKDSSGDRMDLDGPPPEQYPDNESHDDLNDPYSSHSFESPSGSQSSDPPPMYKQPETNPITEDQLINEVRSIYAGLVMVEKKCIEVDKQQTESNAELTGLQWQAMISLHRTLLYEHHDFFLASQHPSASEVLKRLADKYAMPARMWRYGIHSFLELLRQKLPGSLDYMLNFIYIAYSMMTLLLESVTAFSETWIECLGDLARYRMAVEESDMGSREVWAGVSRYWYNQDADRSPEVGRIQHHLAVLARPDVLQQLFHYTKALVSVRPFPNARESMVLLFSPYTGQGHDLNQHTMVTAFIATHSALFNKLPADQFKTLANHFLMLLREESRHLGRQGQIGVYIMSCNFASILQYGDREVDADIVMEFAQKNHASAAGASEFALNWTSGLDLGLKSKIKQKGQPADPSVHLPPMAFHGSTLAFHTLSILLDQLSDPSIYPSVHISLSFIWSLALHPLAMQPVDAFIPWISIVRFLNTLIDSFLNALIESGLDSDNDINNEFNKIEARTFPLENKSTRYLPEDFLIRGQSWSQLYYPDQFFDGAPSEDDRPVIEPAFTAIPRMRRCLWLGMQIATFRRYITYEKRRFDVTPRALGNAAIAETCGGLNSRETTSSQTHSEV